MTVWSGSEADDEIDPDVADWLAGMSDSPDPRIVTCRRIVERKGFEMVDGMVMDLTTANLLVTCYDALVTDSARTKFETLPLTRVVSACWRAVS